MKKRTGLAIAGGVLETIAGVSWLGYALIALSFYSSIENGTQNFDWVQLIFPIGFIIFGIMACVGKMKKDLIMYGLMNFVFIAWLIYKAVLAGSIVYFIYLASSEIIMLILSACFFFFTKKSEYEIVFDKKLNDYIAEEPTDSKKLRKSIVITSAVSISVLFLTTVLLFYHKSQRGLINIFILSALIILFLGFIIFFIIKNKKLKSHKSNANILYSGLSFLVFITCLLYIISLSGAFYEVVNFNLLIEKNLENTTYSIQVLNVLEEPNSGEKFEFSIGQKKTITFDYQENIFTLNFDGNQSFTLECENKITKFVYDDTHSKNVVNINFELGDGTNIPLIIIVSILGFSVCLLLIFGTYKSQYVLDVKNEIKAEENGQVIEKYNENTQVVEEHSQTQKELKEEKSDETQSPQKRVIPPLPSEIKSRLEQNKKDENTQ